MAELNIIEKVIALEAVDLLRNLSPDQLSRIATIAQEIKLAEGKPLLDSAQPQDALYIVLDGGVALERGKDLIHTVRQNEVIGAWSLFDTDPMSLTARTVEPTRVLKISRDDFFDLLSDNMEITRSIFATLVKRFRQLVEQ